LIRAELELLDDLFKGGHCGHNRANGLWFAPIWISTTLCHRFVVLKKRVTCTYILGSGLGVTCLSRGNSYNPFYGYFLQKSIEKCGFAGERQAAGKMRDEVVSYLFIED
jgi:hypothetical protein